MRRWMLVASYCIAPGLSMLPVVAVAQEGCKPLTELKKLPALNTLLDSAGLVTSLPAPDAGGPGEVVVSVMTGAAPQAHVMDSVTAAATGTAVKERVLATLKPGARNAMPAFRVRVALAQSVSIFVEPSILCDPRARGPQDRRASFTVTSPSGPGSAPRPRSVTPRIKIGVNGEVLQVDLGGGTGYPEGDRSLRQALEGQRFEPALLDGRPVQVWLRAKKVELIR
jgi:hypothetical protein